MMLMKIMKVGKFGKKVWNIKMKKFIDKATHIEKTLQGMVLKTIFPKQLSNISFMFPELH